MPTDKWFLKWSTWRAPDGLYHAAYETPQGHLFAVTNIGFEDRADCLDYMTGADKDELIKMSRHVSGPPGHGRPSLSGECRHGQSPPSRCAVCTAPDDPDYWTTRPPDDPRFEWIEDQNFAGEQQWIKGGCHHLTPAPVDLSTGELVAWWCPDCGEQFDRDRWPCPEDLWTPLPDIVRPPPSASETLTPPATPDDDLVPWTTWAYATFLWVKKTAPVIMIVSIAAVCYMFIMIAEANGLDIP